MSLGCGFLENIPHFTFTPPEHQVECARVSQNKNVTYVLTHPHEKSFLALMAIKVIKVFYYFYFYDLALGLLY